MNTPAKSSSTFDQRTGELLDELEGVRSKRARLQLSDEIITRTLPLADRLAGHYAGRGVAIDDLQQVARTALVQAMRRFKGGGEAAFIAFAVPSIRGELKRYFRDRGWIVRPPRRVQEARLAIVKAHSDMTQALGREPTLEELADATGIDVDTIAEAQGVGHCYRPESLDRPFDDSEAAGTLGAAVGVIEPRFAEAETRLALKPLLDQLEPRDRALITLRYFEGLTQSETGKQIGISQMQVSRVESRILKTLRQALESEQAA